jgi:hypothetical protein
LEPKDQVSRALRRFTFGVKGTCPVQDTWGHDAKVSIEDGPRIEKEDGTYYTEPSEWPHDDPRWPTHCACGYEFQPDDHWQLAYEIIYVRADTGEEMSWADAPAGAMWYAPYLADVWAGPDGNCLIVRLPGRHDWTVDGPAANCTMPDDAGQKHHHCWVRHGEPPNITVDKNGKTCNAGAGSIATDTWHGFLRGGYLVIA